MNDITLEKSENTDRRPACGACGGLCTGVHISVLSVIDQSPGTFCQCPACGTFSVREKINYDYLYAARDSTNYSADGLLALLKQYYLRGAVRSLVLPHTSPTARVLDYGCGGGEFANAMYKEGLVSARASDVQLERPQALLQQIEYIPASAVADAAPYEMIVLRHVLEHIEQPLPLLEMLSRCLMPGGRIVIEVPSTRSLFRTLLGSRWPGYFFPYHVHVFSEEGLKRLAARAGLVPGPMMPCDTPIFGVFLMSFGIGRASARTLSMLLYPLQWTLGRLAGRPEAVRVVMRKP